MIGTMFGTFAHMVARRHTLTHVTVRDDDVITAAYISCSCGRLWVLA